MGAKAVLFDMDGTVLDTLDDLANAVNHCLALYGLPQVSRKKVRASLGNGAARLIAACLPEGSGPDLAERVLADYKPWYAAHCAVETRPYPGIVPLMERLKAAGRKLAVVSNKPDGPVRELAERHFPGLLTAAVGEQKGVPRKPDPAAVLSAARLLDAAPEDCVYVGDSEVDLRTAENAGMPCVSVAWGFRTEEQLRAAGAKRLAHDAAELEKLLTEL